MSTQREDGDCRGCGDGGRCRRDNCRRCCYCERVLVVESVSIILCNTAEVARLATAARERKEWNPSGESSDYIEGWNEALDEIAEPMADQLEAAQAEIARLNGCMNVAGLQCFMRGSSPESVAEHMRNVAKSWTEFESKATAERDKLKAELEATRQRIAALEAEAERNKLWSCPDCEFTFAAYHTNADGSMSCPVCEAERMRPVCEAAVQWREMRYPQSRSWKADCYEDMHLVSAVDTYRAAWDNGGG